MKTKFFFLCLIVIAIMIQYSGNKEDIPKHQPSECYNPQINEAEHSAIYVQEEYQIDIFRIINSEGTFIEIDEKYLGLMAEEPYPAFEKDNILFAINGQDTIALGKNIFTKR